MLEYIILVKNVISNFLSDNDTCYLIIKTYPTHFHRCVILSIVLSQVTTVYADICLSVRRPVLYLGLSIVTHYINTHLFIISFQFLLNALVFINNTHVYVWKTDCSVTENKQSQMNKVHCLSFSEFFIENIDVFSKRQIILRLFYIEKL